MENAFNDLKAKGSKVFKNDLFLVKSFLNEIGRRNGFREKAYCR